MEPDQERAYATASRIEAGTVWINQHTLVEPDAPFGGWKASGIGRERGRWGLEEYLETRVINGRPTPDPKTLQKDFPVSVELITLGTAAGPAIRGPENGISSALIVGDAFYMVDFGLGCSRAAHEAGPGKDFVAGFVAHLHSDHVVELSGFLLWNWGNPVEGFTGPVSLLARARTPPATAAPGFPAQVNWCPTR